MKNGPLSARAAERILSRLREADGADLVESTTPEPMLFPVSERRARRWLELAIVSDLPMMRDLAASYLSARAIAEGAQLETESLRAELREALQELADARSERDAAHRRVHTLANRCQVAEWKCREHGIDLPGAA